MLERTDAVSRHSFRLQPVANGVERYAVFADHIIQTPAVANGIDRPAANHEARIKGVADDDMAGLAEYLYDFRCRLHPDKSSYAAIVGDDDGEVDLLAARMGDELERRVKADLTGDVAQRWWKMRHYLAFSQTEFAGKGFVEVDLRLCVHTFDTNGIRKSWPNTKKGKLQGFKAAGKWPKFYLDDGQHGKQWCDAYIWSA